MVSAVDRAKRALVTVLKLLATAYGCVAHVTREKVATFTDNSLGRAFCYRKAESRLALRSVLCADEAVLAILPSSVKLNHNPRAITLGADTPKLTQKT